VTAVRSVHSDVFVVRDDGSAALIGGYSPSSGRHHFPLQDCCPYTGATDVTRAELSSRGTLWGFTAVTARPPGYDGPVPYGFGVVELTAEALRLITRLTVADPSQLEFGQPMELVTDVVGSDDDGTDIVVWAFAPAPRGDR
jgi:uncharacterized OB-fold protein